MEMVAVLKLLFKEVVMLYSVGIGWFCSVIINVLIERISILAHWCYLHSFIYFNVLSQSFAHYSLHVCLDTNFTITFCFGCRQSQEMEEAVQNLDITHDDQHVNMLAARHFENMQVNINST